MKRAVVPTRSSSTIAALELGEARLDALDGLRGLVALADEEAKPQLPSPFGLVVEGEAGRVGAAVLAPVEHRDQGLPDLPVVAVPSL